MCIIGKSFGNGRLTLLADLIGSSTASTLGDVDLNLSGLDTQLKQVIQTCTSQTNAVRLYAWCLVLFYQFGPVP